MSQTTTEPTEQLNLTGFDETMTEIITSASEKQLSPAGLFSELIQKQTVVSEYLEYHTDVENLIYDLEKEHERSIESSFITDHTIRYLNKMETDDRYLTPIQFVLENSESRLFKEVFSNIIGKYIQVDHFVEDLQRLVSPKPNLVWKAKKETILDAFGRDLTQLAINDELPTIIGRDEEVQRMIQILTRQTKSNPILLGKAGVGKTALVEKLAETIANNEVPHSLIGFKIIELNTAKLLSSQNIEEDLMAIIESAHRERAILFIDEVHLINNDKGKIANLLKPAMARGKLKLIGATTNQEYKTFEKDEAIQRRFQPIMVEEPNLEMVYEILKTKALEAEKYHNVLIPKESLLKAISLSDRYIQDRQQPDKAIDLIEEAASRVRAALESKPQVIIDLQGKISEIFIQLEIIEVNSGDDISDREQLKIDNLTEELIKSKAELQELNLVFEDQNRSLKEVIASKEHLITLKQLRDKELHLGNFDQVLYLEQSDIPNVENQIQAQEENLIEMATTVDENLIQNVVVPTMIEKVIETITGIPVGSQNEDDLKKYRDIEDTLKKDVHGQDKAIDLISMAIKRSKAGLSDANKPLGSFICLGPTGVGKTYLAQKLAEFMFDTDKVLKRFDMSEYQESHSVARLFGSPPGYVGHDEGGELTNRIKQNPYSIILFDEIEKAHPKVFNALLQILDAGKMTDGKGNIVNFKNTVIIMTSNIGSEIIHTGLEKNTDSDIIEMALFEELVRHFKPEFLNRFDAKIMFNALDFDSVLKITESELQKFAERIQENNDLTLHWHSLVPGVITEAAYDVTDGARPIKRFIDDRIISILTDKIMNAEINSGDQVYLAAFDSDFDIFSVDNAMLKTLRDAEIKASDSAKKKKKKKKKKGIITTQLGAEVNLGTDADEEFPTEVGD